MLRHRSLAYKLSGQYEMAEADALQVKPSLSIMPGIFVLFGALIISTDS